MVVPVVEYEGGHGGGEDGSDDEEDGDAQKWKRSCRDAQHHVEAIDRRDHLRQRVRGGRDVDGVEDDERCWYAVAAVFYGVSDGDLGDRLRRDDYDDGDDDGVGLTEGGPNVE